MLWKLERMRKRFGCSGGTATKRSVVRVSGNWRKMLKRDRRKTGTSSATTGSERHAGHGPKGPTVVALGSIWFSVSHSKAVVLNLQGLNYPFTGVTEDHQNTQIFTL